MKRNGLFLLIAVATLLTNSVNAQTYDTLSRFGANWRYRDATVNPDSLTWKASTYSDASWSCGPSPLGYGDTWIVTCIQSGCVNDNTCAPACGTKNITAWFRQVINVPSVSTYDSVIMDALIDDGMVMYVNGTQVWSYNMPATFNSATWATTTISGGAETTLIHQAIPMIGWVTGNNTVAVELHQRGPTSSDLTLDVRFLFRHGSSIYLSTNGIGNSSKPFNIYPNPSNGEFTIEALDQAFLSAPVNMSVVDITGRKVADQPVQFSGSKSIQNLNLLPGMYFVNLAADGANANFRITIEK